MAAARAKWKAANPEKCRFSKEKAREYRKRYMAGPGRLVRDAYRKTRTCRLKEIDSQRRRKGLPTPTRKEPELCECCGKPPIRLSLCLDHDHGTGKFRGWLCFDCNTSIGKLGDDVQGLQRALDYLQRNIEQSTIGAKQ